MYCKHCGAEINDNAVVCVKCGCAVNDSFYTEKVLDPKVSDKDWLITAILCLFFGYFGAHRFYVGKMGTAILMLLTCGGLGIWILIDFLTIISERFTDADGKVLKNLRRF
jgi:TM2 domain-containing membrane protein YozV